MGACASTARNNDPAHPRDVRIKNEQIDASSDISKQSDQPRVSNVQVSELEDSGIKQDKNRKRDMMQVKPVASSDAPIQIASSKVKASGPKASKNSEQGNDTAPASNEDVIPSDNATKYNDHTVSLSDQNTPKAQLRMTKDTYDYLKKWTRNRDDDKPIKPIAHALARCFEGEMWLVIPTRSGWYDVCSSLNEIIYDTFEKMCYATEPEEKTTWRTRLFNILEAINSTHTGDHAFDQIRIGANGLKTNFPVTEEGGENKNTKVDIKDFDDVTKKNLYLTSFFPFEEKDLRYNKEDYLFEFQKGENLAIPTECNAIKKVLQRAKDLKEEYYKAIGDILTANGGEHFKCGSKSYLRTVAKLNELLLDKKERPSFKHLYDLLRCKAHFMKPADIKKAYDAIASKFQILRVKNKLHTHLKNITFNLVYKDIISEIQLVLGMPEAESENHILYEMERTHSIAELYEVVEGWGGYDYSAFKTLKANVVEIDIPKTQEKTVIIGDTKYTLLKSKEYTAENSHLVTAGVTTFDDSPYLSKPGEKLTIRTGQNCFFASLCSNSPVPKSDDQPDEFPLNLQSFSLKENDDVILKVEGYQGSSLGYEGLKLHSKKGQIINLGTVGNKPDFVLKAPPNSHIVAFGGRTAPIMYSLFSFYCWIVVDQQKLATGYQGEKSNGVPYGRGTMVYPDGTQYTGNWKNNKKHGLGVLFNIKGDRVYEGEWADDMKHGKGRYYYSQTEFYSGDWKNDKRDGFGQYSKPGKDCHYYGEWKNDKLNGNGILYLPSKECIAFWEDNYTKKVLMREENAFKYSGGAIFDIENSTLLPHGKGVLSMWTTGTSIVPSLGFGEWDHGKGKGCLLATDGSGVKYEGEFEGLVVPINVAGTQYYIGGQVQSPYNNTNGLLEKGMWIYRGGKVQGTYLDPPDFFKCHYSDGAVIEATVLDPNKCKFYPPNSSNAIKFEANTKLVDGSYNDSYYHASTNTLYHLRSPIRFQGKAVDFLNESGKGTWYLANGEKVTGDWEPESGEFLFKGTVDYPSGDSFKGTFKANFGPMDNVKLMEGTLTYKNGNKLEGTWSDNKFENGTMSYSNGDKYIGPVNFFSWDEGKFYFTNGEEFDTYADTVPMYNNGEKVISFGVKGERFELDWDMDSSEDKINVKGTCFYLNGDRYEGEVRAPCYIHGKGTLYYANGEKFEGVWDCENKTRKGKYYLSKEYVVEQEWDDHEDVLTACYNASNK